MSNINYCDTWLGSWACVLGGGLAQGAFNTTPIPTEKDVSNFAISVIQNVLPWVAVSSVVLSSIPYVVERVYRTSEKNLSSPKLVIEERKCDLWSKTLESTAEAVSILFKLGFPALVHAASAKYGLLISSDLLSKSDLNSFIPVVTDFTNKISEEYDRFLNFSIQPDSLFPHLQWVDRIALGVGLTAASWIGYGTYQAYLKAQKEEPKAIFNQELTAIVDDITESIYNTRKNDGYFQNVLLYGPGGTGKTMLAKKIAKNSNMNYVMMSGGDLAQHIKNKEHVTELNKLILGAKNSSTPTILFIDEAEALVRNRDIMQSSEHIELLNAFLNQTGESSKKLMIILAANRIEDIDEAALSRMDHKLHIAPPDLPERKLILEQYIPKFFSESEVKAFFTEEKVKEICEKTEGFTGRSLFKILNAISGKKSASKDNKLTGEMIDFVVNNFVKQEKEVIERRTKDAKLSAIAFIEPSQPVIKESLSVRVSRLCRSFYKSFQKTFSRLS